DAALLIAQRAGTATALEAYDVVRPRLLSEDAAGALVRDALGADAGDELCAAAWAATGGNPLYLTELLRAVRAGERAAVDLDPATLIAGGGDAIARRVVARVRALDPRALDVAQAIAVLGDGCEPRHIASLAGVEPGKATRVAAGLVGLDVLAGDDPPRFIHPVVRDAIEGSMGSDEHDAAHRSAASALHADAATAGRIAAHLMGVRPAGDRWVLLRLL